MATEKKINSRIQQKHDVAANWAKATNFIPQKGEIIIYDAEYNASGSETQAVRFKIGDGTRTVNNLPFAVIDYNGRITSIEGVINGLGSAAQKDVDSTISANSTSTNLPTSQAVEARINAHSGIDKVGTVTSVQANGTNFNPDSTGKVDLGNLDSVAYVKFTGSIDFTDSISAPSPYFLEQNAVTWENNSAVGGIKALTSNTDIGLVIGQQYSMTVNNNETSGIRSGKVIEGLPGVKVIQFDVYKSPAQYQGEALYTIYDHCTIVDGNLKAGNGCIITADLTSEITLSTIEYFSGGLEILTPVTIGSDVIKINSAAKLYINTPLVITGTKTERSITLKSDRKGSMDYELEIFNTSREGLLEIVNSYRVTEGAVSEWGFTKNIGTVTAVKANGTTFQPDSTGLADLGNLGGGSGPITFADVVVMTEAEFSEAYLAGTLQDDKLYLIEGETGTVNFVSTADHIVYNNANSGLAAANLQGAVDEMCQRLLTTAQLNKLIALLDKLTVANDSVTFNTIVKATTFDVQ
jgi:hypothetical protein